MSAIDPLARHVVSISFAAFVILLALSAPVFGQFLEWPLKSSPGTASLAAPARVVQDHSCAGLNLNQTPPPTTTLDDTCVYPGTGKTLKYHAGIDIAAQSFADGTYYAPAAGTIVELARKCVAGKTSCNHGQGNSVVIQHGPNLFTRVDHLQSVSAKIAVDCSAKDAPNPCTNTVARGDAIGVMGATGNVTGAHFHFETFNTYPTGLYGYDPRPPVLDSYQDPWGLVATTALAPAVVETYAQTTLRRGPGTNYSEMVQVGAASRFVTFAEADGWFRLHVPCIYGDGNSNDGRKYNSCAGWIRGTDASVKRRYPYYTIPYTGSVVNIRSAPTAALSTNVVAQAVPGQKYAILASQLAQAGDGCNGTSNSVWHNISLPTKFAGDPNSGWICSDALRSNASLDQGAPPIWVNLGWTVSNLYQTVAQTFTVGKAGILSMIELGLWPTNTGNTYFVDLVPYTSLLAMQPCKEAPCGEGDLQSSLFRTRIREDSLASFPGTWGGPHPVIRIDLRPAGIPVEVGERYAIVVRSSNDTGAWMCSQIVVDPSGLHRCADTVSNAEVCRSESLRPGTWWCDQGDVTFRTWVE